MPSVDKIKKYQLEDRILALSVGHTTQEIATIVTDELNGQDSISQPTVARFIKKTREEREEVARPIINKHLADHLTTDLEILEELKRDNLAVYRGHVQGVVMPEGGLKFGWKERMDAHDRLHDLLKTTFKFIGVGDDTTGKLGAHPVDIEQFRKDEKNTEQEAHNG